MRGTTPPSFRRLVLLILWHICAATPPTTLNHCAWGTCIGGQDENPTVMNWNYLEGIKSYSCVLWG